MKDIISVGVAAAKQAGAYLLANYGRVKQISAKADRNLFTNVDKTVEKMVVRKINASFPGHGILGEEGASRKGSSGYIWIIDPLDGTHNYIRSIPVFGVSIGIVKDKEFVAGVIFMPWDDELYVAEKGSGCYKNGKRIRVSGNGRLHDCSLHFDSGIRYNPKLLLPVLGDLADAVFNLRMMGSSARSLSFLAEGKLDAVVEFEDKIWDCAAGVCLIEEAGGKVTSLTGQKMTPETVGYVAANTILHKSVSKIISRRLK
jgi:myo-inositol-1(or 4)-monophosphatase